MIALTALGGLAAGVGYYDLRYRSIPDWLSLAAAGAGIAVHLLNAGFPALADSMEAGLAGFLLMLVLYVFRCIGGGDVKLFAALCCWFTPAEVVSVARMVGLLGGVLAGICWVLARIRDRESHRGLPYGLAIAGGALAVWISRT